jgi:uncharacterized membrane protein
MKLNLEQINEMIKNQERRVKVAEDNFHIVNIGIYDDFLKSFENKLLISRSALLRLKKYKRKILNWELIKINNEITFFDLKTWNEN